MKKTIIWALIMGLVTVLFGVRLGLLPGIIISWIVSDLVDKYDRKKEETLECPKCHTMNNINNDYCKECGMALKSEEVVENQEEGTEINTALNTNTQIVDDDIDSTKEETLIKGATVFQESEPISAYINNSENDGNNVKEDIEKNVTDKDERISEDTDDKQLKNVAIEKTVTKEVPKTLYNYKQPEKYHLIKYCRKCGAELSDDSQFCRKCGTKIV